MSKWIVGLLALICVVARPGWGAEWERITEGEARISFNPLPTGLSGGIFQKRGEIYGYQELAHWRGSSGVPRAEIYLSKLYPDRVYRHEWKLEEVTKTWNFFKDKQLNILRKNRTNNKLGSVRYQEFIVGDLYCLSFLIGWGPMTGWDNDVGIPPNHIAGYYCDNDMFSEDTVKAVLGGIGVRG